MAKIERQEVEHVAELARLRITGEEVTQLTTQMNTILSYMDKLNELDTSGIEPLAHPLALAAPLREDRVQSTLDIEESLANAPRRENLFFVVPRVI